MNFFVESSAEWRKSIPMKVKKGLVGILWSEEEGRSDEKVIPWRRKSPLWEYFGVRKKIVVVKKYSYRSARGLHGNN